MSRKPQTRSKESAQQESQEQNDAPQFDMQELENELQGFNKESTKIEICQQIKHLEGTIEEETTTNEDGQDVITQKITLEKSGKVIKGKGQSLRQACELVEAWNKSTRSTMQTACDDRQTATMGAETASRPATEVPKFNVVA